MADGISVSAEVAGIQPGKPEITRKPESKDSREVVLRAFKKGYDLYEQTPKDKLTTKEEAIRDQVRKIKERTLDQDQSSYRNRFKDADGREYSQQEYMPVDGIIDFLAEQENSGQLTETELHEYQNTRAILARNSRQYLDIPHRRETARWVARIQQEYRVIQKDPRLSSGDPQKDWLQASEAITKRRELIVPRTPRVTTPPPPTPIKLIGPAPDYPKLPPGHREPELPPGVKPPELPPGVKPPELPPGHREPELPPGKKPPELPPGVKPPELPPGYRLPELPPGTPPTIDDIRRDFAIVNRHPDIEKRAREYAEKKVREEYKQGSFWNPRDAWKKIKLRVGEEYYRQKYIQEARKSMLANKNSYMDLDAATLGLTAANHRIDEERQAGTAKAEQVALQAREKIQIKGTEIKLAHGPLKDALMRDIIKPVINGTITTPEQVQDVLKQFMDANQNDPDVQAIFGKDATQYKVQAEYFASNLLETGELVREDLAAHRYAMEQIDQVVNIQLGNPSWAAETQANFNTTDKLIARLQNGPFRGRLANPAVIGLAASAVGFFGSKLPGKAGQIAGGMPGVGVLAGAGFAALRRNMDLKHDMEAHRVERAYNMQIPKDAKRREALEKFAYKSVASVDDLLNGNPDRKNTLAGNTDGLRTLMTADLADPLAGAVNRENLVRRVAEIQARLDFSAQQKVDLITFENREQVEQGRLELIKAIVEAKRVLRDAGVDPTALKDGLKKYTGEWNASFTDDKKAEDIAFRNYRLKQSLYAGAFAGAVGVGGMFVSQEVFAGAGRLMGKYVEDTALEGIVKHAGTAVGTVTSHVSKLGEAPGSVMGAVGEAHTKGVAGLGEFVGGLGSHAADVQSGVTGAVGEAGRTIRNIDVNPATIADKAQELGNNVRLVGPTLAEVPGGVATVVDNAGQTVREAGPNLGRAVQGLGTTIDTARATMPDVPGAVTHTVGEAQNGIAGAVAETSRKVTSIDPGQILKNMGDFLTGEAPQPSPSEIHGMISADLLKQAYEDPRNFPIFDNAGNHIASLAVSPDISEDGGRAITLLSTALDSEGNRIQLTSLPMWVDQDAKGGYRLIASGGEYNMPPGFKDVLKNFDHGRSPQHDLRALMRQAVDSYYGRGGPDTSIAGPDSMRGLLTVEHGDLRYDINHEGYDKWAKLAAEAGDTLRQGEIGKMSIQDAASGLQIHGFVDSNNIARFPLDHYGNEHIGIDQWKGIAQKLSVDGWIFHDDQGKIVKPQDITPHMNLFGTPPEATQYVPKDVVSAPVIATPFAPRMPLETMVKPDEKGKKKDDEGDGGTPPDKNGGGTTPDKTDTTITTTPPDDGGTKTEQGKTETKTQTRVPIEELLTYEQMKEAGYSDDEIKEHAKKKGKTITIGGTENTEDTTESTVKIGEQEPLYRYEAAVTTKASKEHPDGNEDAAFADGRKGVIAIFDGSSGNSASKLGKTAFEAALAELSPRATRAEIEAAMQAGWKNAQEQIQTDNHANPNHQEATSTGTVVKIFTENGKRYAMVLQAGDSRGSFVQKDGTIRQVTKDDAARLGTTKPDNDPTIDIIEVTDNDTFFVTTTKGVHGTLTQEQMAAAIKGQTNPQELTARLTLEARRKGTQVEDMTAAAIKLEGTLESQDPAEQLKIRQAELRGIIENLRLLRNNGEVSNLIDGIVGNNGWEQATFGTGSMKENEEIHRGYLMVEANDIAKAVQILRKKAQERLAAGKPTEFKFLLMTIPEDLKDATAKSDYFHDMSHVGNYEDLQPTDPRIALYADDATDIQEILAMLAEDPEWQDLEQNRVIASGGATDNAPRRPGSNAFMHNGKEYRTLNYNDQPGYSEAEAANPDWRLNKIGTPTRPVAA